MTASLIYFSLRANAHALMAGQGARSVARRIRRAALLHDHVVLDEGQWHGTAGPTGSFDVHFRVPPEGGGPFRFQTPQNRGMSKGANFHVAIKRSESQGPLHPMVRSATTIAWRPTFEPFKREMGKGYGWLHFVGYDLRPEDKSIVSKMVREDERDADLPALISDEHSRKMVIQSANHALVMGSRMGTAVSMDDMHARALVARIGRGQASPVFGAEALSIMFPVVDDMTWEEIDEARGIKGIVNLRSLLAEIEQAAWTEAEAGRNLDSAVVEQYRAALHREAERLAPSFKGAVVAVAVGGVLSLVTGPLPLAVGVVAGAGQSVGSVVMSRLQYERSWIAAADRLQRVHRTAPRGANG